MKNIIKTLNVTLFAFVCFFCSLVFTENVSAAECVWDYPSGYSRCTYHGLDPIYYNGYQAWIWPSDTWSSSTCVAKNSGNWSMTWYNDSAGGHLNVRNRNETILEEQAIVECTSRTISGSNTIHIMTFPILPKETATDLTPSYNLFKGDSINLMSELGIKTIRTGMVHTQGSSHGTLSFTGCTAGASSCQIKFDSGTPSQGRTHKFTILYVGTNNVLYNATVTVYEMATEKYFDLGTIPAGATAPSGVDHWDDILEGATNVTCKNNSSGMPVTVTKETSGSKNRIQIRNDNNTTESYTGKQAQCTFKKDGKNYTYYYSYGLAAKTPVRDDKSYDAYPKDVFNLVSKLDIKTILSGTYSNPASKFSLDGCMSTTPNTCNVTIADNITAGGSGSVTLVYYTNSNELKESVITFNYKTNVQNINTITSISPGSSKSVDIATSNLVCSVDASIPYGINITNLGTYSNRLTITNKNDTVVEHDVQLTCTGTPSGVGARTFTYILSFKLLADETPETNRYEYELFINEGLDFKNLYGIKTIRNYSYRNTNNIFTITGCSNGGNSCSMQLTGAVRHNRSHEFDIEYVNNSNQLYKTSVKIVEKDISLTTKAYTSAIGYCDFNSDWELAQWSNNSGKRYSFYEAKVRGAVLPNCTSNNPENLPLTFKGWTKGYTPGDRLDLKTTCSGPMLQPGEPTSYGTNYAPCFEMDPHVRLVINSGEIKDTTNRFQFNPLDLTYRATGSSHDETVILPEVEFKGFFATNTLNTWRNNDTGETKAPGEPVKLDGSVWSAIVDSNQIRTDLYKTIGLDETQRLRVNGMTSCSLLSSGYVTATPDSGDCVIVGTEITPFDVYADVKVTMSDGSDRIYKFNVEDRSHLHDDDDDYFLIDSEEIIIGENDEDTLNEFNTDQCETFFISSSGYVRFPFAQSKSNSEWMNTGIYSVYQMCPDDYSDYVALCLDPGRRGPNETGTGKDTVTLTVKGVQKSVTGNKYVKTDDIQRNSPFGKLVMYIVKNLGVGSFDENEGLPKVKRAAAHVAVRSMAIVTGFSTSPDPADETYSSHYYPYQGIANVIKESLDPSSEGGENVTGTEAARAVNSGSTCLTHGTSGTSFSCGFYNWQEGVDTYLIDILTNFDGSTAVNTTDGFERTIEETNFEQSGSGYYINYKGTITAPTGATAKLKTCRNASPYGVSCVINNDSDGDGWVSSVTHDNRTTYRYDVTVRIANAGTVKPPQTVDEEKDLSFQIEYTGGYDLVNAFIASPSNGSDNVQRMLVFSTSNPKVYVYFSIVPNNCNLDVLKQDRCPDEATCLSNISSGAFNSKLFTAAKCCQFVYDETSYLFNAICSATCTSSTLAPSCPYTTDGKGKADLYEIKEGTKFAGMGVPPKNNIGSCVINVNKLYKNDYATSLDNVTNSNWFTDYDDRGNLMNVDAYRNNRYCQVSCKEDWQLSMDSWGNFIGKNAVAAGTYFQIVDNDMFIAGKRTCFTTFINYDRFMANIVDLSNLVVENYNYYSRWSHVWTDVDKNNDKSEFTNSVVTAECVEYFDKCPQKTASASDDYYWSDAAGDCRRVPNYGQTENATCESLDNNTSYTGYWDYANGDADYTNSGKNEDATQCKFNRYYCNGHNYTYVVDGEISGSGESYTCSYDRRMSRTTSAKVPGSTRYSLSYLDPGEDGTCSKWSSFTSLKNGKCYQPGKSTCTGAGYDGTDENGKCYYLVCPSGTTPYNGYCYDPCSDSDFTAGTGSNTPYCYDSVSGLTAKKAEDLKVEVVREEETLKCKTMGKGYDFTLNTIGGYTAGGEDLYYTTTEQNPVVMADKAADGTGNDNTENRHSPNGSVPDLYDKMYTHKCEIDAAEYKPGAQGSSNCYQEGIAAELTGASTYPKENDMFCTAYADLVGTGKDKAFCKVSGGATHTDTNTDASDLTAAGANPDIEKAFEWVKEKFKDHAQKELNIARSNMTSYQSQIYSHAQDLFDCQNFRLHNRTDDETPGRANNSIPEDTIMSMRRSYVKILTDFDPTATYTYAEKYFMDRVDKDNVLIQYTEKNDAVYAAAGNGTYGGSTDKSVNVDIDLPGGTTKPTTLDRNFIETFYYNPEKPWAYGLSDEDLKLAANAGEKQKYDNYDDGSPVSPVKEVKQIVLCSVGGDPATGVANGKDGAVIPFSYTTVTPEWKGGKCFLVKVDYKKVHYVKSSISNSSYYKNRGYWYVRGGDSKIHGDDISYAIEKFNRLEPAGYVKDYSTTPEEKLNWSRLGSFNVFPIAMATPRSLYSYTYTFGKIGSYYDGKLGRIMGTEKSIIQNNKRTCYYEVYEEVCLCCGYEPTDDPGPDPDIPYPPPTIPDPFPENPNGTIAFYPNTVTLGDIGLGRDPHNNPIGTNWSDKSPFMYNGVGNMTTDKGDKLKHNLENIAENIYAKEPEYAYFLTPDSLREIRSYNDANGYSLDVSKLKVYESNNIACNGASTNCPEGGPETISFQHYGSKFLIGDISKPIDLKPYGFITNADTEVCEILDRSYSDTYDMAGFMVSNNCRWVDYIESDQSYKDPTTQQTSNTYFRLSFK